MYIPDRICIHTQIYLYIYIYIDALMRGLKLFKEGVIFVSHNTR
jgi:hypothetical protein